MLILTLLLWAAPDETRVVEVTCPVDGARFKAEILTRTNAWGGIDRDFCRHAFNSIPMDTMVWTCPGCHYSGLQEHFTVKDEAPVTLEKEVARKIREGLKPARKLPAKFAQADVPTWVRFDLMAQGLTLQGRGGRDVGNAYLYASWIVRQHGAPALEHFDEYEQLVARYELDKLPLDLGAAKVRNRTDFELARAAKIRRDVEAGGFAGVQQLLARYLAARTFRRHGENAEALALVEIMKPDLPGNSVVRDAVAVLTDSIDQERAFQRKAAAEFERALKENTGLKPEQRGELLYQLGELNRRLGQAAPAADHYRKAIAQEGIAPAVRTMAEEQLKLVAP